MLLVSLGSPCCSVTMYPNYAVFHDTVLSVAINSNERIPNRKDSDYFVCYENPDWKPTSWYNRIFNFIYRVFYFITGPKFVVPILGNVPENFNHHIYVKYDFFPKTFFLILKFVDEFSENPCLVCDLVRFGQQFCKTRIIRVRSRIKLNYQEADHGNLGERKQSTAPITQDLSLSTKS